MQIIFTSNDTMVGRLIRYFTKRSWLESARVSHVAIRLGEPDSKWMVEATPKNGFGPNWWPKFLRTNKVTYVFDMLGCDENLLTQCMEDFIDKNIWEPYDWIDIVGMMLAIICYWITGKRIKNPFSKTVSMTCTESTQLFMNYVFEKTGIRFFKDRVINMIFPEDHLIECEQDPVRFRLAELGLEMDQEIGPNHNIGVERTP